MKSDSEKLRSSGHYRVDRAGRRSKKHAGASLGFCWGFGFVVCLTFGLASFLMFSAGHFSSFSPDSGVNPAYGEIEDEVNFNSPRNLFSVEVTDLSSTGDVHENEELYAQANDSSIMEEFGPFPSYLSDFQSITLTTADDGTKLNVHDYEEEDEDDVQEISTPAMKVNQQQPILVEAGPSWHEHAVKSGETLSDIAHLYGNITVQDILRANELRDANKLAENQILLIPHSPDKVDETLAELTKRKLVVAANQEKVEPLKVKEYVVAQGDTLWSIAQSQNIESDTIRGSNNSRSSATLRPGLKLRIPNQDGIFYTLKDGETVEDAARRYRVSMSKIKLVNEGVDIASLKKGDEIFLPGAKPEAVRERRDSVRVAETKKPEPKPENSRRQSRTETRAETRTERRRSDVAVRSTGFRWPIMGRINSPFGWRQHPVTRRRDFHTGIDIKANRNDPIKAAGSGRVVYSGWMGGYGKVLVIEHNNGQSTLYAHCSTLLAGKGASVSSGQLIAKIGTTGRSTGPHLHFEVRNGNSPVNPIKYLGR